MAETKAGSIAERIVQAREASGLSTAQLARRLGVQSNTLTRWENGQTEPRGSRLMMLSGMLNVSSAWLLSGIGEEPTEDTLEDEVLRLREELRQVNGTLKEASRTINGLVKRLDALGKTVNEAS